MMDPRGAYGFPVPSHPVAARLDRLAATATVLVLIAGPAVAGETVTPSGVRATSYDSATLTRNLINGSGLSGAGAVETRVHDADASAGTMWHAGDLDGGLGGPTGAPPAVDTQAVTFDLGARMTLDGAYVWNHNQESLTGRGVRDFTILVSSDADPLTATFTSVGSFLLDEACGCPDQGAQFVAFAAANVRLVKFDIDTVHSGLTDEYVGLSEVRFSRLDNVDPGDLGAQYAWGENIGWVNAEPQGDGGPGMTVSDDRLTGWMWSENAGWISLSCENTSSCSDNGYGVVNDGKGNLSGHAWGENLGWISFGSGGGGDCCIDNGTPGCGDTGCEAAICLANPSCCAVGWDASCAAAAAAEPACTAACEADPIGVRIHPFTGRFSGFAWTEHDGRINFGPASQPGAQQIATTWRCADTDADGICTASDPCGTYDASGRFGQTVRVRQDGNPAPPPPSQTSFVWEFPVNWRLARGTFTDSAEIGTYTADLLETGTGTETGTLTGDGDPAPGDGFWYLLRPDCAIGSYSTGSPSERVGRDEALIP